MAPWNIYPYTYDEFKLNVGGTYSIYGNLWVGENHQERKQTKFGKEWIHQILGYIDIDELENKIPKDPGSPCQMMIGLYNHLLSKVFRFHYHSQKVSGSLGNVATTAIILKYCWTTTLHELAQYDAKSNQIAFSIWLNEFNWRKIACIKHHVVPQC